MKHISIDPEKAFAEVDKLLYKLAWRTHRLYGVPLDDCISECFYAFVKAVNWRYDPTKGTKFSTQVQTIAQWRLKSLVIKRINTVPTVEFTESHFGAAPPERSEALEAIEDLSECAKEILGLLLETPGEVLGQAPVPVTKLLGKVKRYLVDKGRQKRVVDDAHKEITARFQEVWA